MSKVHKETATDHLDVRPHSERKIMDNFDLVQARKKRRYNQAYLATLLGVSQQMVSLMEKGRKPLTNKALDFIGVEKPPSSPPLCANTPKTGNLVVKKMLKTKELRGANLAESARLGLLTRSEAFSSSRLWEKWWYQETNPRCESCTGGCKQSLRARVIRCYQYSPTAVAQ